MSNGTDRLVEELAARYNLLLEALREKDADIIAAPPDEPEAPQGDETVEAPQEPSDQEESFPEAPEGVQEAVEQSVEEQGRFPEDRMPTRATNPLGPPKSNPASNAEPQDLSGDEEDMRELDPDRPVDPLASIPHVDVTGLDPAEARKVVRESLKVEPPTGLVSAPSPDPAKQIEALRNEHADGWQRLAMRLPSPINVNEYLSGEMDEHEYKIPDIEEVDEFDEPVIEDVPFMAVVSSSTPVSLTHTTKWTYTCARAYLSATTGYGEDTYTTYGDTFTAYNIGETFNTGAQGHREGNGILVDHLDTDDSGDSDAEDEWHFYPIQNGTPVLVKAWRLSDDTTQYRIVAAGYQNGVDGECP